MADKGNRTISVGDVFQERYEILSKISEGGFGEVFQARQLATSQTVALKTLRQQQFQPQERQLARFRREVKLCAKLHHPHIVGLIDFGSTDDGVLYTIFEYVPGRDLKAVLAQEGPLPPHEVTRLLGQVLDALSCAHSAGIVHRDLKPGNVMIVDTGARPNAMVLDFGIGAILPSAGDIDEDQLTATFEQLGTPAYAAPELLRGKTPVPASDLYAWGLVAIECLTGVRAVPGESAAESIHEQLSVRPVAIPPSIANHRLGALLRLVTNKKVEQRQITADELLRQLERCDVSDLALPRRGVRPSSVDLGATMSTRIVRQDRSPRPDTGPRDGFDLSDYGRADTFQVVSLDNAERRQITAVCYSIDMLVEDPERIDLEDHDALLHELQEGCSAIIERYDGHVASVLGHQTLACFGYPNARADDARRAAIASLAILDEMAASGAELARVHGGAIDVRVGVHTGLVVVRNADRSSDSSLRNVLGATPGLAVRVNSLAQPGTVVVSETTSRLLGTEFSLDPIDEHLLGRASRPLMVFELHRRAVTGAQHKTDVDEMGVAMVGRDEDLALLRQRWHQSRQGRGQAVLITGEAGIGKSRLLRELTPAIQDLPHIHLEARCTPEGRNASLRPVIDLLQHHLGIDASTPAETGLDRLAALCARCELEPAEYAPILAGLIEIPGGERFPLPQLAPQRLKSLTLDAVIALFAAMAAEEPLLLTVEDLHWADATTIELISLLLEEVATTPMCMVLTARPVFTAPWRANEITHIHLGRLGDAGVAQMATRLAGDKALPSEVLDEMARRTDGIPLFVEELTRAILESGALEQRDDGYHLVGNLATLDIPGTLRDSLMARLDRLGPAKTTAQLAAVIGREFDLQLLGKIAHLDDEGLADALARLMDAELVHRRRRLGGYVYLFRHALIQDIAYESLLKSARRGYHGRIAEVLSADFPEVASTRPEIVARHYAEAQQITPALDYAERAGQLALQRWANAEAIAYMRQALGWLESLEASRERDELEMRCNMVLMQGLMAVHGLAAPEFEELVVRCKELLTGDGELPSGGAALAALCLYHQVRAQHAEEAELARRYLDLADAEGDPGRRIDALRALGGAYHYMGQFEEARRCFEQSVELHDSLPDAVTVVVGYDSLTLCQLQLCFVLWAVGYPDQALAMARDNVARSKELNLPMGVMGSLAFLGGIHQFRDEPEEAGRVADELVAFAAEFGAPQFEALASLIKCWTEHEVGRAEQILAGFAAFGQELALPYWHATVAESEMAIGHLDAALARLDKCLEVAARNQEGYYLAELHRLRGDALRQRGRDGDREAADTCYREAIATARSQAAKMLELRAAAARYRLHADEAANPALAAELQALYDGITEGFDTPVIRQIRLDLESAPG